MPRSARGSNLFALDPGAGIVKTYAVERFVDAVRRRTEHFTTPNGWRPEAHIAHAFGIISGVPERVVIAFDERVLGYIRERIWHPTQTFRTLPDGRLELTMQITPTVELQSWVQGFGPEAEVLAPPDLRQRVAVALHQAAEQYGAPS